MMRRKIVIRSIIGAVLLILAIPLAAASQGRYDRNDRRYLRDTIYRLDSSSAQFSSDVFREFNRDWLSVIGTRRDNFIRSDAGEFRRAVRDLGNRFDGRDLSISYDEARRVLQTGARLDRDMQRVDNSRLTSDWFSMRRDLQAIANAYGLSMRGY
jgi:hypothetical protein